MVQLQMVVIDSDEASRKNVVKLIEEIGFVELIGDFDNMLTAYDVIMQARPPLVFFDLTENVDLALDTIEKIATIHKHIIIIVASENVDAELVIQSMRVGAREFLTKPVIKEDIHRALKKARNALKQDNESSDGKIISIFSNKGGIGKTTIATNFALQLSEITGEKVCLIDLNLQMGDVATFLDINPSFDIAYVITHLSRLDESFLHSSLERYRDKDLYILADPPDIEQAEEISVDDIASLLTFLKTMFGYIVIDTSSSFDVKTLTCLDISDFIFLVLMVNLPSIRNCQKCLSLFKRLEYDEDKIKLIVNRYIEDEEITLEDVEEALSHEVYWKIPNNYFSVMSSINKGIPVSEMDSSSEICKNFIKLTEKLTGVYSGRINDFEEKSGFLDNFDLSSFLNKVKNLDFPAFRKFLNQPEEHKEQ